MILRQAFQFAAIGIVARIGHDDASIAHDHARVRIAERRLRQVLLELFAARRQYIAQSQFRKRCRTHGARCRSTYPRAIGLTTVASPQSSAHRSSHFFGHQPPMLRRPIRQTTRYIITRLAQCPRRTRCHTPTPPPFATSHATRCAISQIFFYIIFKFRILFTTDSNNRFSFFNRFYFFNQFNSFIRFYFFNQFTRRYQFYF